MHERIRKTVRNRETGGIIKVMKCRLKMTTTMTPGSICKANFDTDICSHLAIIVGCESGFNTFVNILVFNTIIALALFIC